MNSDKNSEQWEKTKADEELAENALLIARRDLKTARNVYEDGDYDWSLSIAYNSMLQSARALMHHKGYRPKGEHKHLSTVMFLKTFYEKEVGEQTVFMLNKIRKKRHAAVYEETQIISRIEAEGALKRAEELIGKVQQILTE